MVRAVVRKVAERKIGLFYHFRDVDEEDLFQVGYKGVWEGWHAYNPAKASPSTFIYTVAWRRIRDLSRSRERMAARDTKGAIVPDASVDEREELDMSDDSLAAWLRRVYAACQRAFPPGRRGRGRPGYPAAMRLAVGLLMHKQKLSSRGAWFLLLTRVDLRDKVLMLNGHVPDQKFFVRAANFASDNPKLLEALGRANK